MEEYYEDGDDYPNAMGQGVMEKVPCKRDFEFEINRQRERLQKQEAALSALESLMEDHGGIINDLPIKKLIGTAYVRTYEYKKVIAALIKEQEQAED